MTAETLYFEDLSPGLTVESAPRNLSVEEIFAFARAFDPQPFHLDIAAAERSVLGGLAASGWQTAGIAMRLFYDSLLHRVAGRGGPGVENLRWIAPVRPDTPYRLRVETLDGRLSRSRPEIGIVRFEITLSGPNGPVADLRFPVMVARRAALDVDASPPRAESADAPIDLSAARAMSVDDLEPLERLGPPAVIALGDATPSADDVKVFARAYDPQPFHLDEAAGRASVFGGLAASGWHIGALWMRAMIDARGAAVATLPLAARTPAVERFGPSPGVRDIAWKRPALAGRRLRFFERDQSARRLQSRPDWGMRMSEGFATTDDGRLVMRFGCQMLMTWRDPAEDAPLA